MKSPAARERKSLMADGCTRIDKFALNLFEVVRINNNQWTTRSDWFSGCESTSQTPVVKLGIGGAIVHEFLTKHGSIECLATRDIFNIELNVIDAEISVPGIHYFSKFIN